MHDWIDWAARRFEDAGLHFGHGTDNSRDEAAWLVMHAIGISPDAPIPEPDALVDDAAAQAISRLVRSRIERRCPAAYLTGTAWFAGLEFEVGPEVLVPRSPIAELILDSFQPWLDPAEVGSVLEIGTGSGCIAIACALRFPGARVVATDVSEAALAIAARNVERHGVSDRVRLLRSDVFDSLGPGKYDLIVSNPPYVPASSMRALPVEFRAEPALGLQAARGGLEIVLRILAGAREYLAEAGILVCEVGESQARLARALPETPFLWLEFASGGGGIFLLERSQMGQAGRAAARLLKE